MFFKDPLYVETWLRLSLQTRKMEFLFYKGLLPADLIGKKLFFSIVEDCFRAGNSLFFCH